jgi:NADH-quinone oxidoreductase subunit M
MDNVLGFPLLSITLWLPALGALLLLLLPRDREAALRQVALGFTLLTLLAAAALLAYFDPIPVTAQVIGAPPVTQLIDTLPWVPQLGISYTVSVDGTSIWLVLLTAFLAPIAVAAAQNVVRSQLRYFFVLLLLLETALLGVFVAQDLFLFYIFWEFTLVPMALLIGIWGGARRVFAAQRFFLYTFAGSVLMLLGIIGLFYLHRNAIAANNPGFAGTFDWRRIVGDIRSGAFRLDITSERLLFFAFLAAFAVKVPLWPFHTWLPDAYEQAPTPALILLAGVMPKLGSFGLLRYNVALFPDTAQWAAPAIAILAVAGILYGAITAFAQTDMKRLVAYSSFSHMGFIALGVFSLTQEGISGAVLQMVNHGITTSALFLVVAVLAERRGTTDLRAYSGVWGLMPIFGGIALVVMLASMGLPGLNAFVGEYAVMQGTLLSSQLPAGWAFAGFAVIGVILAAAYLLRMFRVAFMGEPSGEEAAAMAEIDNRELTIFVALLIPMFVIGLYPNLLFDSLGASVADFVNALSNVVAGS